MDNLIVSIMDAAKSKKKCHLKDEVEKNSKNRITENYRTRLVQTKCENIQNHGDQWLTVLIADFTKLHISNYGLIWNQRNSPVVKPKIYKSSTTSDRIEDFANYKRDLVVHEYNDDRNPKRQRTDQHCDRCIRLLAVQSSSTETTWPIFKATNCNNTLTGNEEINLLKNSREVERSLEMDTDVDSQLVNSSKLIKASKSSMVLKNLVNRMIERNTVVTLDPVIDKLVVFFTQNEYVKKWEFKKKTSRSRTLKRLLLKLLKIKDMRKKNKSHFASALVCIFRKTIESSRLGWRETKSQFFHFLYVVGVYIKRIDRKLWECWYKPDEAVKWWSQLTSIFNE